APAGLRRPAHRIPLSVRVRGASAVTAPAVLVRAVNEGAPRALSLLDRLTVSPTRGSFDRAYWHYRTDKGYASATFQQLAWPLAALWSWERVVNPWRRCPALLEAARSGLLEWARIQHRDGSFAEWYPGERSHVATAFTTYAAADAARLLGDAF